MKIIPHIVPLPPLAAAVDPLDGVLWGCGRIDQAEIEMALAAGDFESRAWDQVKDELHGPDSRNFHIRRIAHFVVQGLPDDDHKIRLAIDGGDPAKPVRIDNGNHRIAAAIIRGDEAVKAMLYFFDDGDVGRHLPGAMPA